MSDENADWVPVYIGKGDDWFDEWESYYATETSRGAVIKRHMRLGLIIDQFWEENNLPEPSDTFDWRMALKSILKDGLEAQDDR